MTASFNGLRRVALRVVAPFAVLAALVLPASATDVLRVVSPGGIEAWLVREPSVPMIAIDFAFRGGSTQDPIQRAGLANLVASLMDEGAGDLDAHAFHERMESNAIGLGFSASRDELSGSLHTLNENQDTAFELMRLALTAPRFDNEAVERIRGQVMSILRSATTNPNEIASKTWWAAAFPGHPYAVPVDGTLDSVPSITADDLRGYVKRVVARDTLKIGIVGNVDVETAGKIVDKIFGGIAAKADLVPVPDMQPQGAGRKVMTDLDVAQSVIVMGHAGIARPDPDFMAAYVLNHILGGGSMSSRLYREVREVRGLAYSVYSSVYPLDHTSLFMASTATRADRTDQTLDVMQQEIQRMAQTGPTEQELADAKSFLKGSFPLRFDSSSKISSQLVQLQLENLGIDYIAKRNSLVDAVTLEDLKRVAKRLLDGGMLVAVVGRLQAAQGGSGGVPPTPPAKREGG